MSKTHPTRYSNFVKDHKGKWHINALPIHDDFVITLCEGDTDDWLNGKNRVKFKNSFPAVTILPDDANLCRKCLKILINENTNHKFDPKNEKHLKYNNYRFTNFGVLKNTPEGN